jgi:hypothetical protein
MERLAKDLSSEQLVQLFEQATGAIWRRADITLGEITLTAIADRVLHNAAEKFPLFESLEVGEKGVDCQGLLESLNDDDEGQLTEGIRFVLLEFLLVIGNLTAGVLTPALHSELDKVSLEDLAPGNNEIREGN